MKKQFTRTPENYDPPFYQCCKCKWEGLHSEKDSVVTDPEIGMRTDVCPNCGNEDFYGINYLGKKKPL